MELSAADRRFVEANSSAAMITVGKDGYAKAVKCAVGYLDDRMVSSGTRDRKRTHRLRADPRCTLYIHDQMYGHLVLETVVTIDEATSVPSDTMRFFRLLQHKPSGLLSWFGRDLDEDEFLRTMTEEGRVLYVFDVQHSYGLH